MTAPMTFDFPGLGNLGASSVGHHADMAWCFEMQDQACVKGIENTVKEYYTTDLYNRIAGTLRDAVTCYVNDSCNPSPELAGIIKNSPGGSLSKNLRDRMDGYIRMGGTTGSTYTDDPNAQQYIDKTKEAVCMTAAALGQQLPDCPPIGGTTSQTTNSAPPPTSPKSETNWLLIGGIAVGALVLLGGAALIARKRKLSGLYGYRGLGCGSFGCSGFGGLGRYQPWNARAAARFNARQYPCR